MKKEQKEKKARLHNICYGKLSKKGTVIVEAVIFMPIVILTVVAILSLGIQMYDKIKIQTENHSNIRQSEQGEQADFARKADFAENLNQN